MPEQNTKILFIITGAPGTGKSCLARLISMRWPETVLLSYDALKEEYFDKFGFNSIEEKNALTDRCLLDFYGLLCAKMKKNVPILIEYPFCRKHVPALQKVILENGYTPCTIVLYGDWETLWNRQNQRDNEAGRHLGHLCDVYHKGAPGKRRKLQSLDEFRDSCLKKDYYIDLGNFVHIDVTDFAKVNFEPAFTLIETTLNDTAKIK